MAFDPENLKKHAKKGKFGLKTEKKESDAPTVLRAQQDLLTTRLTQTLRKSQGQLSLPSLYKITGKQVALYEEALKSIGVDVKLDNTIKGYLLDRTGFCPELVLEGIESGKATVPLDYLGNHLIIISPYQSGMSVMNPRYSFLNRLLDQVYNQFSGQINTFTRSEAIVGDINNIVIEQGVERFLREGGYKEKDAVDVVVSVNTPTSALSALRELKHGLKDIENVYETITDHERMSSLYQLASELKGKHKKLNDLQLSDSENLDSEVSCFRYGDAELELFYFKTDHKPVFIFFASNPESEDSIEDYFDSEFIILNGDNRSKLINNVMDIQMIDYLVEFIENIRDSYAPSSSSKKGSGITAGLKAVTGKSESDLPPEWHTINDVAAVLRMAEPSEIATKIEEGYEVLGSTSDLENMRGQYIRSLPADTKSQIVFPRSASEDRLVCELISECCPSEALTLYQNTQKFTSEFASKSENEQIELLKELDKDMRFENQNNLLVNSWLKLGYPNICKKAGVSFYSLEEK